MADTKNDCSRLNQELLAPEQDKDDSHIERESLRRAQELVSSTQVRFNHAKEKRGYTCTSSALCLKATTVMFVLCVLLCFPLNKDQREPGTKRGKAAISGPAVRPGT